MEEPIGKIINGNVCFIRDLGEKKVLLLKRNREPMQGLFTGVGGKTLPSESAFDSCVREAKEETGLDIAGIKLKGVVKTILDGSGSIWILSVYVADKFKGRIVECNEGELEWVDFNKLGSYKLIIFIPRQLAAGNKNNEDSKGYILWSMAGLIPRQRCIFYWIYKKINAVYFK